MDRSSRFQNPMPLSTGGFNKPPPIQNDGVGMKPLPPLILDRFRAMVKEREEDLRVFGGPTVLPLSTDEIVRLYEIVLSELTINSKPIITDLTIIAGEQKAHGEGIAGAICDRIIEVPDDQKLPSLYLLDSIVKNIGKEYIKFFSTRLPEIFCEAYAQVHPNMHPAMRHLFGTWSAVFPISVLEKIDSQLHFSASVNGRSTGLSSSQASESPQPTHGIHINPKYLEAQHQFGHTTGDLFGTEAVSSTGRAGLATSGVDAVKKSQPSTARTMKSSSPYGLVPTGSLSPSLDERVSVRVSPSHPLTDYGLSKVMSREEETSEWQKRNWQGNPKPLPKASAPNKYSTGGLDLRGPRALISAYGIDEREKHLNRKPHTVEELDLGGAEQKIAIRTWQNTEEEEFDWDGITPTLADRKQSNDTYPSLPPHGNLTARNTFTSNQAARLPIHGPISKISGVLPNVAGPSDLTSHVSTSFARESLIIPRQQSQSHFNAKGGGSLDENRRFLNAGEQKIPFINNFSNIDGKVSGPYFDLPAPDIRLPDAATLTKPWQPTNFQNPHILSSTIPSQMPIRGQFAMNNVGNIAANQIHSDPGSSRSMPHVTLPLISGIRPGLVPVNMQRTSQPSLAQPNLLMIREARPNLPLPSSAPIPSNSMAPHPNYGYLAQGPGGPGGPTPSNLVPAVQSSFPTPNIPNMPFQVHGATLQPLMDHVPQATHIGQNTAQVTSNAPVGSGFSGLISSLMAQGLISLTKQDSLGVEFDQEVLKVRHEAVINSLYADLPRQCTTCGLRFKGQEEHSKHMDWHVSKNRTLKNRKTKPSPKWFVSVNMWLSGAESLGTEAVPGFLPAENNVEKEDDEELAVPADEDQNACALCGEPFDDFYSDETEEWMYRGAVYMHAPAAGLTVGMDRSQLGPIVHAKCRSDSHGVPSEDFIKGETESNEEGSRSKRFRS